MKYYVVRKGHQTWIVDNWETCKSRVVGYPNAQYKSFPTREAAQFAFEQWSSASKGQYTKEHIQTLMGEDWKISIATDAACPRNPWPIEYRAVDIATQEQLFHRGPLPYGSINIAEFLAIVDTLSWIQTNETHHRIIYTDSQVALNRVNQKSIKTTLEYSPQTQALLDRVGISCQRLRDHADYVSAIRIKKRPTHLWGQIPADFGRK